MSVIDGSNVFYYVSRFTREEYVSEVPDSDRYLTLNAVADLAENKDTVYLRETEKVYYGNLGGDEENGFSMDDDTFDINEAFCFKTKNGSALFYTNKLQGDGYNEEGLETFVVSENLKGIVSTKDLDLISFSQGNDFFQNCKIVNEQCINNLQSLVSAEESKEEYEGFIDKDSEPYGKQTIKNKETLSDVLNYLKFMDKQIKNTKIVIVKEGLKQNIVSLTPKYDFSYRLYMSAGTVSDSSQLYPVLDEIEEGKIGLLSAKAEKLDAIVGQALPGFEKVSGLSVVKGKTDTYGLMGRYQNGSDVVSVFAKTDNKAGNGYYEVSGHCDANYKSEVLRMVRHAELFHGLTVYNGLPTKDNNLGLNDGSLLASGVSKEAGRSDDSRSDDTPVVDFSDVGKKKGSTLSLA